MISPSVPSPDLFRCSLSTVPIREKTAPQRPLTAPRLRSSVGRTRFVARSAVRPRFVCSAVIYLFGRSLPEITSIHFEILLLHLSISSFIDRWIFPALRRIPDSCFRF